MVKKSQKRSSGVATSVMDKRIWCIEGMTMTVENEDYYLRPAVCI
jgi:hypothetical protein